MMRSSRSGGAISVLITLIVLAALTVFVWVLIANWRRTGEWSCRPLDSDWWSFDVTPAASQTINPDPSLSNEAKRLAQKAEDSLWGDNGLIQKCEDWWKNRGTPSTVPSVGHPEIKAVADQEEQLRQADIEFRAGLDVFKQASPSAAGGASRHQAAIKAARVHFLRTRDLIDGSLPSYEKDKGSDPGLVRSAHQLREYDQQLIDMVGDH